MVLLLKEPLTRALASPKAAAWLLYDKCLAWFKAAFAVGDRAEWSLFSATDPFFVVWDLGFLRVLYCNFAILS